MPTTPEHRFTISDYILDSVTVTPNPSPSPRPDDNATMPPATPSKAPSSNSSSKSKIKPSKASQEAAAALITPFPMSPSTTSPTSISSHGPSPTSATSNSAGGFRALPDIPRAAPLDSLRTSDILGPGPQPIPVRSSDEMEGQTAFPWEAKNGDEGKIMANDKASPEQPPSRTSTSSPSPTAGVGLTYPPRSYTSGGREYYGPNGMAVSSPGHGARPMPLHGSTSNGSPYIHRQASSSQTSQPGHMQRLDSSSSSHLYPQRQGSLEPGYPHRQASSASSSGGYMHRQPSAASSRHPMEPRTGLSPLPSDGRLSMISDVSGMDDEKYGPEKGLAPTVTHGSSIAAAPKPPNKWIDGFWPKNLPCRLLIVVTLLEAIIDIAIQANLLWRYEEQNFDTRGWADGKRLRYFLIVFIIAHLVQITLTAWAVYYRNTIQVIGLTIFNLLLLIYAAIQVGEINVVLGNDTDNREGTARIFSLPIKILSGLVIAVIAAAQIAFVFLAYFIWREFGWRIYRFLGADLAIRRYYRQYQVFECILCFSFFFFLGFSVQFLGAVLGDKQFHDPEYIITIIMLPVTLIWLAIGAIAGRWEKPWLMGTFITGLLGGMAYFIFKLTRIWSQPDTYEGVQKSLTIFSVLSLAMLVLCIVFAALVWRNFGKGLQDATGWSSGAKGWRSKHKGRTHGHQPTPSDEFGLGASAGTSGQNFKMQNRLTIE